MRHTFQITVDYNPDDAHLAWLLTHDQTRKTVAKRIVLAQIDLHPDLTAITGPAPLAHKHTHTHRNMGRPHSHYHVDTAPNQHAHRQR